MGPRPTAEPQCTARTSCDRCWFCWQWPAPACETSACQRDRQKQTVALPWAPALCYHCTMVLALAPPTCPTPGYCSSLTHSPPCLWRSTAGLQTVPACPSTCPLHLVPLAMGSGWIDQGAWAAGPGLQVAETLAVAARRSCYCGGYWETGSDRCAAPAPCLCHMAPWTAAPGMPESCAWGLGGLRSVLDGTSATWGSRTVHTCHGWGCPPHLAWAGLRDPPQTRWNHMAGWIWPAGRILSTPGLDDLWKLLLTLLLYDSMTNQMGGIRLFQEYF